MAEKEGRVVIRHLWRGALCTGVLLCAQAAQSAQPAGHAGLWFQCQPKWKAEKNYLLVDVKAGEREWDAKWGAADSAKGKAQKDAQGNLLLRGCHALGGKPAARCDAARPPLFATLPKAADSAPSPEALRRGAWIRTDAASLERLARDCAGLRPQGKR